MMGRRLKLNLRFQEWFNGTMKTAKSPNCHNYREYDQAMNIGMSLAVEATKESICIFPHRAFNPNRSSIEFAFYYQVVLARHQIPPG